MSEPEAKAAEAQEGAEEKPRKPWLPGEYRVIHGQRRLLIAGEPEDPMPDDPAFVARYFGKKPAPPAPADWFSPVPHDLAERLPKTLDDILRMPGLRNLRNVSDWGYMRKRFDELQLDRVRGIQKRFGLSPWEFVPDAPDVKFGLEDYEVVGHRLNFTRFLTRDQALALWVLLKWKNKSTDADGDRIEQTSTEQMFEGTLLCLCPRSVRVSPVDIDVRTESEEWRRDKDRCRRIALEYAREIVARAPEFGLGRPLVFVSNRAKGSLHVDFLGPEGAESVNLAHVWESVIVPVLEKLGIPLVEDHSDLPKDQSPAVLADDTLFHRDPDSRGALWRPCGAAKPRKNREDPVMRKLWMPDLSKPDELRDPYLGMPEPGPADLDMFRQRCRETDEAMNAQPPSDHEDEWDQGEDDV